MRKLKYKKAIDLSFPYDKISLLAKRESWRKEVYRPIYYLHKWWAKRLGSVFRAILIGSCAEKNVDIYDMFYRENNFSNIVVYDPMMGSGVTLGEAKKIGCKVIGRDINPVSYLLVKSFLNDYNLHEVITTYKEIEHDVSEAIKKYYKTLIKVNSSKKMFDVLYYFWVMVITCPNCAQNIDLFKNRIFVKNAYPKKDPKAKSICPNCNAINSIVLTDMEIICNKCKITYNPHKGNVGRTKVNCPNCDHTFSIINAFKKDNSIPQYRMYAKMILNNKGKREYHGINSYDKKLFNEASKELKKMDLITPKIRILPGYNTDQILNYNFTYWDQLFNDRQLLCLGILRNRIKQIQDIKIKELFTCLFSGCLEFNNMFCSFKGEGTGAVRHMFSHHILKPERAPLEANLWGTPKSSGSFSTLFKSRVLRSLDYVKNPFELAIKPNGDSFKVYDINNQVTGEITSSYRTFQSEDKDVYLSCGSASSIDIETCSVDVIVTDPPFFDNVHYSELADFFFVWQREIFDNKGIYKNTTTRSSQEVQDGDPEKFSTKLADVYKENNRVLKNEGIMIFTFHHSNTIGWVSILESLYNSNFYVEKSYPVKSEMSVSVPLNKSKSPINYDMILLCRKKYIYHKSLRLHNTYLLEKIPLLTSERAKLDTIYALKKLKSLKFKISTNDVKCIYVANLMSTLTRIKDLDTAKSYLISISNEIEEFALSYIKSD